MRNLTIALVLLVFVVVPFAVMKFGENKKDEYKQAAFIANGLAVANSIKVSVVQYYSERGKYPQSNSVIGVPSPESFSGQGIRSIEVRDGAVVITYSELSGVDGGTIHLIPGEDKTGYMMNWRCETGSYRNIKEYVPQCDYIAM